MNKRKMRMSAKIAKEAKKEKKEEKKKTVVKCKTSFKLIFLE